MKDKFIKLTPFKMQVLQSFPFIDEDFDALTNYELLCKVVEYLNKTVENVELLDVNVSNLNKAFNELKSYVDNLDVQDEINNKIDAMVEDGTFAEIMGDVLHVYYNSELYGRGKNTTLHINSMTSQDIPVMPSSKASIIEYGAFDRVGDGYTYDDQSINIGNKLVVTDTTNTTFTTSESLPENLKVDMYVTFYGDSSYSTPLYLSKIVSWNNETNTVTVDGFTSYSTKLDETPEGIYGAWINPYDKVYDHYDYIYMDKETNHILHQYDVYNYTENSYVTGISPVIRHGNGGVAFRARTGSANSKWVTAFGTDGDGTFDNLLVNKTNILIDGQNRYRQPLQMQTDTSSTYKTPVKKIYADTNIADLGYPDGSIIKIVNGRNIALKLTGTFDGLETHEITQIVIPPSQCVVIGYYDGIYRLISENYINQKKNIPKYTVNKLNYGFLPITANLDIDTINLDVGDVIMVMIQPNFTITSSSGKLFNSNSGGTGKTNITASSWTMGFIYRASANSYWCSI